MKALEQIKIKPCSYKGYDHISGEDEIIDLYDNHFRYRIKATGQKMDEGLGVMKEQMYDADCILMKDKISAVDFGWAKTKEVWEIEVHPGSLILVFKTKEEGLEVKNKLFKWLTS